MIRGLHSADPSCPICQQGLQREAAHETSWDMPRPFHNEEHPSGLWFHGTHYDPKLGSIKTPDERGEDHSGWRHWNTHVGTHFSSLHEVGHHFATERTYTDNPHSRIAHASIHMKNPRVYASEHDMTDHAFKWARKNGFKDYDVHTDGKTGEMRHEEFDESPSDHHYLNKDLLRAPGEAEGWLQSHPRVGHIASGFKKHLQERGHDGIVYGNEHEGPQGHECAIAFRETPVHVHEWEHVAEQKKTAMGQAGPDYDNLTFHHGEHELYPADNGFKTLFAHHPEHGNVGRLTYRVMDHPAWTGFESPTVHVTMMHVEPEHQRRGVASQLMDHLEKVVHKDTLIDHGERRPDGQEWAKSKYNDRSEMDGFEKSRVTKNGRPWNLDTKKPWRMPKNAADWDEFRRVQDGQQRRQETPGNAGSKEDRDRYFGLGEHSVANERLITPKDWIKHDRKERLDDTPPEFQENWRGHQLGFAHAQTGHIDHEELEREHARSSHGEHFLDGYHEGLAAGFGERTASTHYHVAPSTDRESIAQHGLDWRRGPNAHIPIKVYDDDGNTVEMPRANYLYRHIDSAKEAIPSTGKTDLYEVDTTGHHLERDPYEDSEAVMTHEPIHPSKLRRLEASKLGHFIPSLRIFTHTCGLDHRLWDADQKLKPEVKQYVLHSITVMWNGKYRDWSRWARIYFAGSEASEWTSETLEGNNDFDVLVGVDYAKFREANPRFDDWGNEDITDRMNQEFRQYNGPTMLTIDGTEYGPFDRTTYVNLGFDDHGSYDLRVIKPYAAYDVGKDEWVVKPPHLPHWSFDKLPKATQKVLKDTDSLVRDALKLPEPERTQQGAFLFDSMHTDRSRAFGPNGEGWIDIANLREKWLDQAGLWAQLVDCKHRFNEGLGVSKEAGANGDLPEGVTFRHGGPGELPDDWPHTGCADGEHEIRADHGGRTIGQIKWLTKVNPNANVSEGHITRAGVHPDYQRRGLATELLRRAREIDPRVHHSNNLTSDGRGWAEKTAGSDYQMMRPSELSGHTQRDDLDHPWNRHKIDWLKDSISEHGYVHGWGDDIKLGEGPEGPRVENGNKRLKALRELGYDAPIPVRQASFDHWTAAVDIDRNRKLQADIPDNEGSHYRMIGEHGYHDFLESGTIRPAADTKADYQHPYFMQGKPLERYRNRRAEHDYVAEAHPHVEFEHRYEGAYPTPKRQLGPGDVTIHRIHVPTGKTDIVHSPDNPHPVFRSHKIASPDSLFKDVPDFYRMWNKPAKKTAMSMYDDEHHANWQGDTSMDYTDAAVHLMGNPKGWSSPDRIHPESLAGAKHMINGAQRIHTPLYSGHAVMRQHKEGEHFTIPLMATSRDRKVAEDFAEPAGKGSEPDHGVYEFPHGAHAVEIHPNEHVVTGEYRVHKVEPHRVVLHPVAHRKIAMAWDNYNDLPEGRKPRPKSVRRAGFAGFVAGSDWERGFKVNKTHPNEIPDHIDDHLRHFAQAHGTYMANWKKEGTHGPVDLSNGVYATQTHVSQFHIDRYKKTPHDTAWHFHEDNPDVPPHEEHDQDAHDYSDSPMFVTHQGRLHAIDGHHRVASILQDGGKVAFGWHYNLDEKPVVKVNGNACSECTRHASQSDGERRTAAGVYKTLDQLAPHERAAAETYHHQMVEDGGGPKGAHGGETPHDYHYEVRQEPKAQFLKRYMDADNEFKEAYGPDEFQAHHEETLRDHPIPHYPSENRWPLIVNDNNPNYVDDGYHRMHSYIRDGATHIPTMRMHWKGKTGMRVEALSRAHHLFGKGLHALFGDNDPEGPKSMALTPFPRAGELKDRHPYDQNLVGRSITHPHEFPVEDVDPRELHSTQPSVTRDGVKHYMEGGTDYGKSRGDNRLGNDLPRIYHRQDDDRKIILSGHHRAVSALLAGEPLKSIIIRGGYGADR